MNTVIVCNRDFCKEFIVTNQEESDMVANLASETDAYVIMWQDNWGKLISEYVVYSCKLNTLWEEIRRPNEKQRFFIDRVMCS